MSTDDQAPDAECTETPTAPDPTTDADGLEAPPRRPPEADDPPRGATRSLGGYCPDCDAPMTTRLRADFTQPTDRPMAHLKVVAICDGCGTWLEGYLPAVRLTEKEV